MRGGLSDKHELFAFRVTLVIFTCGVLVYAMVMKGTPIYEMVSSAYQVTLCGALVPLVCGLYWPRSTKQGAFASIVLGILTWLMFLLTPLGEDFPAQLAGVILAIIGMVAGSLLSKPHAHEAHVHAQTPGRTHAHDHARGAAQ